MAVRTWTDEQNHMTYHRASKKMKEHLCDLEKIAFQRLKPSFAAQGVVEVP